MMPLFQVSRGDFLRGAAALGTLAGTPALLGATPGGKPEKPNLRIGLPVDATSFLPTTLPQAKPGARQGLDVPPLGFRGDAEVAQALAGDSTDINVGSTNGL